MPKRLFQTPEQEAQFNPQSYRSSHTGIVTLDMQGNVQIHFHLSKLTPVNLIGYPFFSLIDLPKFQWK